MRFQVNFQKVKHKIVKRVVAVVEDFLFFCILAFICMQFWFTVTLLKQFFYVLKTEEKRNSHFLPY